MTQTYTQDVARYLPGVPLTCGTGTGSRQLGPSRLDAGDSADSELITGGEGWRAGNIKATQPPTGNWQLFGTYTNEGLADNQLEKDAHSVCGTICSRLSSFKQPARQPPTKRPRGCKALQSIEQRGGSQLQLPQLSPAGASAL